MVAAILAVAAAIAAPRYAAALDRYRVSAALQRISADIAFARAEAVRTSSGRTITFDMAARRYTVAASDVNATVPATVTDLSTGPCTVAALYAYSVPATTGLKFDGFGQANATTYILVVAGQSVGFASVDAASGRVTIQ
jgi:Tfp pilus assembly protein FimT